MRISPRAVKKQSDLELPSDPNTVWFAERSCVVIKPDVREVYVGGSLLGAFGAKDVAGRNVLLVLLADQPDVHLGKLAQGFGLTFEGLRMIRHVHQTEGLEAIIRRKHGGRRTAPDPSVVKKAEKLFAEGASVSEATAAFGKSGPSRATVGRLRQSWAARAAPSGKLTASVAGSEEVSSGAPPEAATARVCGRPVESATGVQHLGSWLLLAGLGSLGLHHASEEVRKFGPREVDGAALRIAIDAFAVSLAVGERCVEGTRRLATPEAAKLLRATQAPSATWVRRTLGKFSTPVHAAMLQLVMANRYITRAAVEAKAEGPVFYVDNHMRTYTGKEVVRRGWRMQDKRVRPGASDYYVHDEDGRPVLRHTAPAHDSLTKFLSPIAAQLRDALPSSAPILLAFDRAGAFPAQMAELRETGFEFVTWERKPYSLLAESEFTEEVVLGDEKLRFCEPREKNLGKGRGRVRRICMRTEEGRQINLVGISKRPAKRLIEVMRGRWVQENGFKHANERWGINQLDGRRVTDYPEDTIVPNPARRRLEDALRIARAGEGLARLHLARLSEQDSRRPKLEAQIHATMKEQEHLLAQRPQVPTHAPLSETALSGVLVHHTVEYKLVLDTIRIACANAEAELALMLAAHAPRPREAKKLLACIFAAPGTVRLTTRAIHVTLSPAANVPEQKAIASFFADLNRQALTLPADQSRRPLRFRLSQVS